MRRRRRPADQRVRAVGLGDECDAFLAGEWVEQLEAQGEPVPDWAWLNQVAHASERRLRELCREPAWRATRMDDWARLRSCLAETLLTRAATTGVSVADLQLLVLVPCELRLCQSGRDGAEPVANATLLIRILSALRDPMNIPGQSGRD